MINKVNPFFRTNLVYILGMIPQLNSKGKIRMLFEIVVKEEVLKKSP